MPVGKPGFGKALKLLIRLKIASDRKRTRASSDVLAFVRLQLQAHRNAIDLYDCRTNLNGGRNGDDLVGIRFCRDFSSFMVCVSTRIGGWGALCMARVHHPRRSSISAQPARFFLCSAFAVLLQQSSIIFDCFDVPPAAWLLCRRAVARLIIDSQQPYGCGGGAQCSLLGTNDVWGFMLLAG